MLTLGPGHYSRKLLDRQPYGNDLRRVRAPSRAPHPRLQLLNVVTSLGFLDPVIDLGLRALTSVQPTLHADNRITNHPPWPEDATRSSR
jgi:hypothetical protein